MRGTISTTVCGLFALVYKYIHAVGYNKSNKGRKPKEKTTSKKQSEINQRMAADKLFLLIQGNFQGGDLHIIPTYTENNYPYSVERMKADHNNFIRRMKYIYAKFGAELKYIHVVEYLNRRPHDHYIINKVDGIDIGLIQKIWGKGLVRFTPLEDGGYYRKLSDYLIKETSKTFNSSERVYAKRWTASRNLIKPEKHIEVVTIENEDEFLTAPAADEVHELIKETEYIGVNEYSGTPYIRYVIKLTAAEGNKEPSPGRSEHERQIRKRLRI